MYAITTTITADNGGIATYYIRFIYTIWLVSNFAVNFLSYERATVLFSMGVTYLYGSGKEFGWWHTKLHSNSSPPPPRAI